jgi:flagellar hook-length control protein FliK
MPEVMQPRLQAEQGNRPQAAAGVQQSQTPEQQSQAPAAQAQPQRENTLSALFGEAVVEETVREPDPLRQLHQQGMMQQGFQQNNAQSQQNLQNMLGRNAEGMAAAPTGTAGETAEPEAVQAPQAGHEAAGALTSFRQEVQNAARTTEAPALQQPQDDFEVPRQIVEQARLIRSGGDTEMVIHLKPEHLGDLTLKVSVSSTGAVTASFHSDNAQVRAIIENSLVQLRHDLNSQGIKVDDVEVYAGLQDEHLPQGQGQQQAWQGGQGSASGQGRNFSAEDYAEEAEDLSVLAAAAAQGGGEDNTAMEGVDYRI